MAKRCCDKVARRPEGRARDPRKRWHGIAGEGRSASTQTFTGSGSLFPEQKPIRVEHRSR